MAKAATATQANKALEFTWQGKDRKGNAVKGTTKASNEAAVRAELRKQGINPQKIKKAPKPLFGARKKKIQPKDIAVFSRQLATMMAAGVPLVQSFDIVGRGHENPSMQELILTVKTDVEGGISFSEALRKHPLYFDDLFVNLVNAGEQAGVLDTLLDKIATYKEKTESLKGKINKALFYPITVMVVAVVVVAIIMIFVIPQFQSLFEGFGADLPAFTQMVVDMSNFTRDYWWALLFAGGGIYYSISAALKRSRTLREALSRGLLRMPVIGNLLHKSALARFARTLGTMFAAGVPLVEALNSVAGATGNVVYSDAVLRMREDVATGQSLLISMKQQNLFPHMMMQMVSIGEESGALDDMLNKVADFYEEEVDNAVDALTSLMEPFITVFLGVVVGGLVVALYLPIFKLGQVVSG